MNQLGLCLSTGRCGTTYLAHCFRSAFEPEVGILHESAPELVSKPNLYLGRLEDEDFARMRSDRDVASFLAALSDQLAMRPLVEFGNTVVSLAPLLIATFPGRVKILHLVRDPVTTAASFTTFLMNAPELEIGNRPPNPIHSRCVHSEYAAQWEVMSPFEKNLWRWAEYNLWALEIHRRHPELPYMRLTAAELFRDHTAVQRVAQFFGLPPREISARLDKRNEANPSLRAVSSVGEEWRRYVNYPYILELAEQLGVPVRPDNLDEKMTAYSAPTFWELAKHRWRMRFRREWFREKVTRFTALLGR
jgi:hypothetical protein